MADALIERLHPGHENRLSIDNLYSLILLLVSEDLDQEEVSGLLGLNGSEENELAEVMETQPTVLQGLLATHDWALRIRAVLICYENQFTGFETAAEIRGHLGLPTPP